MSRKSGQSRLGRFAFAATIFVAGVIVFTSWSYYVLRNNLLADLDESLSNAAFAAREIVGDDYAQSLLLIGNTNAPEYAVCSKQLERFAKNGGFSALGVAARQGAETLSLVAGSGDHVIALKNSAPHGVPLSESAATAVLGLAAASDQHGMALLTMDHPQFGMLRAAVFYKGHSDGTGLAYIAVKGMGEIRILLKVLAIKTAAAGLMLLIMAIPLVALYNRAQHRASKELATLNERLKHKVEGQQEHEEDLKDAISDLERFTAVSTGRENRIIELKGEVNGLRARLNLEKRYNIDKAD